MSALPSQEDSGNADLFKLLHSLAQELTKLHDKDIVHGDLTASTIHLSDGMPKLAFSNIADMERRHSSSENEPTRSTWRYSAPELLSGPYKYATMASDVYSFGSLAYNILTGIRPYDHLKSEFEVIVAIDANEGISRPHAGITDEVWEILKACWVREPELRLSMQEIGARLAALQQSKGTIMARM
ncbi:kinase-like domain-containing protein [Mycena floridula]|nr:kinase-like domain-containing protein [Mycena floridula]